MFYQVQKMVQLAIFWGFEIISESQASKYSEIKEPIVTEDLLFFKSPKKGLMIALHRVIYRQVILLRLNSSYENKVFSNFTSRSAKTSEIRIFSKIFRK